ncbi:MAG: hypothetical protein WA871_15635 [Candidatus Acidiferrales bacterium]
MRTLLLILICAFSAVAAQAQTAASTTKIFISNSNDWQKSGGFKTRTPAAADSAPPNSAHLNEVSAMASQCSTAEVTSDASKASYILLWDTKALWNALSARTNLLIMYTPKGDAVYSVRSDSMDSAAKHVCEFLVSAGAPAKPSAAAAPAKPPKPAPSPAEAAASSKSGL